MPIRSMVGSDAEPAIRTRTERTLRVPRHTEELPPSRQMLDSYLLWVGDPPRGVLAVTA